MAAVATTVLDLALVQPRVTDPSDTAANVAAAVGSIHRAAELGAGLIAFPEAYPGPMRAGADFDSELELAQAAAATGTAVCWCRLEADGDLWHMVAYVHGPDGKRLLRYVRAHPATGDVHPVLHGAKLAPGPGMRVVEVCGTTIGIAICSELWIPEAVRVLAVQGAELILAPAGGGFGSVAENWRLIARARAIENNCYVAMTHSRYMDELGAALIAGPEHIVAGAERSSNELVRGRLDLERSKWLRASDDSMADPKPFDSLPGLLRAARPELYGDLSAPRDGLYDYTDAGDPRRRRA